MICPHCRAEVDTTTKTSPSVHCYTKPHYCYVMFDARTIQVQSYGYGHTVQPPHTPASNLVTTFDTHLFTVYKEDHEKKVL
ncbi:hypothetical protein E2C01_018531 [Portunus trituberculatus]|uniref:Uncharacterized protein n=1 Tax=Portunus trituberculatus TaxID=210409 RepID=A0A5B7DVA3_PORTR|nr:hypothetical protein [Portunus trituberculatus]